MLSSGYGTLNTWETGFEAAESPGRDDEDDYKGPKHRWTSILQEDAQTAPVENQQEQTVVTEESLHSMYQQKTSGYV